MACQYHPSTCNSFKPVMGLNPYHDISPTYSYSPGFCFMINACKTPYMDDMGYMGLNDEGVRVQLHGIGSGAGSGN